MSAGVSVLGQLAASGELERDIWVQVRCQAEKLTHLKKSKYVIAMWVTWKWYVGAMEVE